jgi:hypothetical protein
MNTTALLHILGVTSVFVVVFLTMCWVEIKVPRKTYGTFKVEPLERNR